MRYWGEAQCEIRGSISEEEIIEEIGMMDGILRRKKQERAQTEAIVCRKAQ